VTGGQVCRWKLWLSHWVDCSSGNATTAAQGVSDLVKGGNFTEGLNVTSVTANSISTGQNCAAGQVLNADQTACGR